MKGTVTVVACAAADQKTGERKTPAFGQPISQSTDTNENYHVLDKSQ